MENKISEISLLLQEPVPTSTQRPQVLTHSLVEVGAGRTDGAPRGNQGHMLGGLRAP